MMSARFLTSRTWPGRQAIQQQDAPPVAIADGVRTWVDGNMMSSESAEWGSPTRVANLVHRDAGQRRVGQQSCPTLVRDGERDEGASHAAVLVPRQVGLAHAVVLEVIDPPHHDVGAGRIGRPRRS